MGTRRARRKGRIEIEFEPFVLTESILRDLEDVDFVVALEMNDSCGVFVKKVVRNHQATVVASQHDVVWSGICTEADDRQLLRIGAIRGVQHAHLARHEETESQSVSAFRGGQNLPHSARDRSVYVRPYRSEVKRHRARAYDGVNQIEVAVEHPYGISVSVRVLGQHLYVHAG